MTEPDITKALWDCGVLMGVHVNRPTFHVRNRPSDLLIDDMNKNVMDPGFKKMIAPDALKKLATLESKARTCLTSRSVPFKVFLEGRFVYSTALPKILKELESLREEFNAETEAFVVAYPRLKDEALTLLDAEAQKLVNNVLKNLGGESLDQKRLELDEWFVGQCEYNRTLYKRWEEGDMHRHFLMDWSIGHVTMEGMENMNLDSATLAQMQSTYKKDVQNWVREATVSMHQVLGEKAVHIKEMLEKQGKLNPKNLKPFFEALEAFKDLDFTNSSGFRKSVEEIQARFGVVKNGELDMELTAAAVTGSQAQFTAMLNTVSALASSDVAEQAGLQALASSGQFNRVIDL